MPFSADISWEQIKKLAPFPEHLTSYFKDILKQYDVAYHIAETARSKGFDPNDYIESKTVLDLADRVNQMLGLDQFEGLVIRLRELLKSTSKEKAAITIAQEIALGKFGSMSTERALEYGVRAGLAVITDGVTVAPIQGVYAVSIKKNDDNSSYASISYAGPMRSAGGTEAAFSLIIGDLVAKKLGLSNYRAREEEIGRFIEELRVYEREVANFQYRVSDEDVRTAISNLPIEIDGVETDPVEVVVHRNLARVGTDRVRGGALRVLNDGVIGRAHKLAKILADQNTLGWDWLAQLKGGKQQSSEETEKTGAHFEEVISGRAVLSAHNSKGGFRIRYGRSINTGLSTIGIHPAVPVLLDYPVVVGTQVKVDLPGKAATIAFVDSIEGPTVLLRDGSVVRIHAIKDAEEVRDKVSKIIDLGDALISFGDFLENNKELSPSPYTTDWWILDLKKTLSRMAYDGLAEKEITENRIASILGRETEDISAKEAITISEVLKIPLYPRYQYRFDRLQAPTVLRLRSEMTLEGTTIIVDLTADETESILRQLLIPYQRHDGNAVITGEDAIIISHLLQLERSIDIEPDYPDSLSLITRISGIRLCKQSTATVGMRVGRPEKAMLRHLKPPVHILFPVDSAGGSTRDLNVAAKRGTIRIDTANVVCPSCEKRRLTTKCEDCGEATTRYLTCPKCGQAINQQNSLDCPKCKLPGVTHSSYDYDIKSKLDHALKTAGGSFQKPIKGVRGLTSQSKIAEPIEKGVLRSKHDVFVYKDGTIRADVTNAPLTHFRPRDILSDPKTLRSLGYETDIHGEQITNSAQIIELKPQDIIIPIEIADDLVKISRFVDEELMTLYGTQPLYKKNDSPGDLTGKIVLGLAPHTSVAVVGRIIGFTNAQVCFANPCWHASKRRDCDGDGDSLLLLLDVLLNFSEEYLPDQIGGLMDTPLLIQPVVLPSEVDGQAHNFDVATEYPLDFYAATQNSANPSTIKHAIDTIGKRLNNVNQFYTYGFTNSTSTILIKRSRSAYSTLKTLVEKVSKQIEVAEKIEAVSTREVVESIIKTHLLRDVIGNMKKYSTQSFRCRGCGRTFRRPSVSGRCEYCKQELHETVSGASVEKYLSLAKRLANEYNVDEYVKSRLELAVTELDQLFQGRDKSTQLQLTDFAAA